MIRSLSSKANSITSSCLATIFNSNCRNNSKIICRINHPHSSIHTTRTNLLIWEPDEKAGYDCTPKNLPKKSMINQLRESFGEIKSEIVLWKNEVVEHFENDPIMVYNKGEVDVVWLFDSSEKIQDWTTTSDSDHNEGYSQCSFTMSKAGRGLFSGTLDTRVPKDGKVVRAGYCGLRSQRVRKSFRRNGFYDWSHYNTLVLKVRGDGRSYLLNISQQGFHDLTWNDIYHYVLYTRGGPYWQVAKIPFSKFFRGSKGKVQDKQCPITLDEISHFGITCGDKINGHFALEIEYIGLEFDPTHTEEFAYEMYQVEPFIVGSTLISR